MIEQLLQYDTDLFIYLNGLGTPAWDGFWKFMSHKFYQTPLYAILLYLVYKKYGVKGTLFTLLAIALLITATDQTANLFKNVLFKRPRPCRVEAINEVARFLAERCGRHGYFSAHAASSMGLAFFIGKLFKRDYKILFPIMIFWAILVGYSRIYVGVHYPGDVITGMVIGTIFGTLFYKLQQFFIQKWVLE